MASRYCIVVVFFFLLLSAALIEGPNQKKIEKMLLLTPFLLP